MRGLHYLTFYNAYCALFNQYSTSVETVLQYLTSPTGLGVKQRRKLCSQVEIGNFCCIQYLFYVFVHVSVYLCLCVSCVTFCSNLVESYKTKLNIL